MSLPVLVVGAGPTGLVTALWLAKAGVPVRLIDRAATPGETSRAIGVQARTLEFYRQLGIDTKVVDAGIQMGAANAWSRGHHVARVEFGNMGQGLSPFPYMLIYPQDEHERLLLSELEAAGISAERPVELTGFEQRDDHVAATLRHRDGREEVFDASYIAGCDGARSRVRDVMGAAFAGGTYEHVFYVADVVATGEAINGDVNIALTGDDFLAIFPLKGTNRARLIGIVRDTALGSSARDLTWNDASLRVLTLMKIDVTDVLWFSTYRVHHRVASRFRDRRVFLAGDAAHVHSPVGAQGMNTGIGDAVNLGWKLADVIVGGAPERLLDTYHTERSAFARKLVATTDRVFTFISKPGVLAESVRLVAPYILAAASRLSFVRRFAFLTVSQLAIEYRDSAVSVGQAGRIHAGDRLPWINVEGTDNHATLNSRAWQIHVYGTADNSLDAICRGRALETHTFAWRDAMGAAGVRRDSLFVVRPDGYIGFAGERGSTDALVKYLGGSVLAL